MSFVQEQQHRRARTKAERALRRSKLRQTDQAVSSAQRDRVGDQTAGRVALFLATAEFDRDYQRMRAAGVRSTGPPRQEPYGTLVVFEDLYGKSLGPDPASLILPDNPSASAAMSWLVCWAAPGRSGSVRPWTTPDSAEPAFRSRGCAWGR